MIQTEDGRLRRLTPVELERLNGFPDHWTATGMPDGRRAFMMGNALVVGLIEKVGGALAVTPAVGAGSATTVEGGPHGLTVGELLPARTVC